MHRHGYIGRKMHLPKLQEKTAIVIAAFGSSSKAATALELFRQRVEKDYPDYEHFWAYTSEIIRKKRGLPGLHEMLAKVEASGYRKAVIQPLHVFPGTEYQQLVETSYYFPGLRCIVSETLCHRWQFVRQVLDVISGEFLLPHEGLNLLVLHGTPLAADPVNSVYLGLERTVTDLYDNVFAASIEGVPDSEGILRKIGKLCSTGEFNRIRIIPLMYFAGVHVEKDLMGGIDSWREVLESFGLTVECPMVNYNNTNYFKGIAYYPECLDYFVERLNRALLLAQYY